MINVIVYTRAVHSSTSALFVDVLWLVCICNIQSFAMSVCVGRITQNVAKSMQFEIIFASPRKHRLLKWSFVLLFTLCCVFLVCRFYVTLLSCTLILSS